MASALRGEPLTVFGTGSETRDYTYVDDVVSAILLGMKSEKAIGKVFNVGSGTETTTQELAEAIIDLVGSNASIERASTRSWDTVTRRCADISLIQKELGFRPTTSLLDGLKFTHEWFLEGGY